LSVKPKEFYSQEMEYEAYTMSNGIRVVHKRVNSPVAHCCIIVNAGSRDENAQEQGMAHFIEHVLFKGTTHRKSYHILSRLEDVGGELNAYTTKEETCLYATFLKEYYNRSFEIISDVMFHSIFPKKELEKEKDVILDEINSYKDDPSELIFDEYEELLYKGHPLARNILGDPETIRSFTKKNVLNFMSNNYHTDEMVVSSVGDIPFSRIKAYTEKYFGTIPARLRTQKRLTFSPNDPFNIVKEKKTFQTHCIIGNYSYDIKNEKRIAMHLLNNILGGPGMNSRLSLALRERNGYSYNIESNYTGYSDTGAFCVYFSSDKENSNRCLSIINKEFKKLRNAKLGTAQLSKAKKQLIGQLAISSENNESLMLAMGKSYMLFDYFESLQEVNSKIESVTAEKLMEIANEILDPTKLSTLLYN
jgi:predicted Zn-dependent peptidase